MRNAIPLDLRVLATLKNSSLGLDLYMFIAWRTFKLDKPVFISWESLKEQLGGQYHDIKFFARDCRSHIRKIQAIKPDLNVSFIRGRLCLKPFSLF
jgi:Plasmid encoded RepA protein